MTLFLRMRRPLLFLCLSLVFIPMQTFSKERPVSCGTSNKLFKGVSVTDLCQRKLLFTNHNKSTSTDVMDKYLDFYQMDFINKNQTDFYSGYFQSGPFKLVGYVMVPQEMKKLVIISHGFYDHSARGRYIFEALLNAGYGVAAFDLPGHGFSSGRRGDIDNFFHYAKAQEDFIQLLKKRFKPPYDFIAYSTGTTGFMSNELTGKAKELDKIVLLCPLVHSYLYGLSKVGYKIFGRFLKSFYRGFMRTKLDRRFTRGEYDPLVGNHFHMRWLNSLIRWNNWYDKQAYSNKEITIIQGTKDNVVDWKDNIILIKSKFPNSRFRIIKKARHQLVIEDKPIRQRVINEVLAALGRE
jgi:alpha-beta hydrolase superfamily lysophospholipase